MQGTIDKKKDSTKGKHILVIEDSDIFREALAKTLTQEGFLVTQAAHGKLAQEVIGIQDVDVVISDINLPGMSGIELMHFSKKTKPNLPFILMTGFAELKETKEAYEMGARGFLQSHSKKKNFYPY